MAIPDYQTLMLPVLRLAAEGETRVPDVEQRVADDMGLTAEERNQLLPSGRQRTLHNRVHWAKSYMSKAGLITSPRRGTFVATAAGRALLATNPDRIDVQRLLDYPGFREFRQGEQGNGASPGDEPLLPPTTPAAPQATPEEQIEIAHAAMQ